MVRSIVGAEHPSQPSVLAVGHFHEMAQLTTPLVRRQWMLPQSLCAEGLPTQGRRNRITRSDA